MTPTSPRRALAAVLQAVGEHSEFGSLAGDLILDPRARLLIVRARRWGIVNAMMSRTAHAPGTAAVIREIGRMLAAATWTCEAEAVWATGTWALALGIAGEDAAGSWDAPPPETGAHSAGPAAPLPGPEVRGGLADAVREARGRLERVDETLDDLVPDMHACDLLRRVRSVHACDSLLAAAGAGPGADPSTVAAAAAAAAGETATNGEAARWAVVAWLDAIRAASSGVTPAVPAPAPAPLAAPVPEIPETVEFVWPDVEVPGPAVPPPRPYAAPAAAASAGPVRADPGSRPQNVAAVVHAPSPARHAAAGTGSPARRGPRGPVLLAAVVVGLGGAALAVRMHATGTVADATAFAASVTADDDVSRLSEIRDRRAALAAAHVRHLAPAEDLAAATRALAVAEETLATGFLGKFREPVPVASIGALLAEVSEALSRPELSAWTSEIAGRAAQRIARDAAAVGPADRRTLASFPEDLGQQPIAVPVLDGEGPGGDFALAQKWITTLRGMPVDAARDAIVPELAALGLRARDARVRELLASRPDADRIAEWRSRIGRHVDPGLDEEMRRAEATRRDAESRIRGAAARAQRGEIEGAAEDLVRTRPADDADPDAGAWSAAASAVQDEARSGVARLLVAMDFDAAANTATAVRALATGADGARWTDVQDVAAALRDDPFRSGPAIDAKSKQLASAGARWRGLADGVAVASVRAVLARWKAGTDGATQAEVGAVLSAWERVRNPGPAIRLPGRESAEIAFAGANAALDLAVLTRADARSVSVASPQIPVVWQRVLEAKRDRLAWEVSRAARESRARPGAAAPAGADSLPALVFDARDPELSRCLEFLRVRCHAHVERWAWPVIRADRRARTSGAGALDPAAARVRKEFAGPPDVWQIVHADADVYHRALDRKESRYPRGVVVAAMLRCGIRRSDAALRSQCSDDLFSASGAASDASVRADLKEEMDLVEKL